MVENTIDSMINTLVEQRLQAIMPKIVEDIFHKVSTEWKDFFTETPINEQEACVLLGISKSTIAKYRTRPDNPIPYIKGKTCKYLRSDLRVWLQREKGIMSMTTKNK